MLSGLKEYSYENTLPNVIDKKEADQQSTVSTKNLEKQDRTDSLNFTTTKENDATVSQPNHGHLSQPISAPKGDTHIVLQEDAETTTSQKRPKVSSPAEWGRVKGGRFGHKNNKREKTLLSRFELFFIFLLPRFLHLS